MKLPAGIIRTPAGIHVLERDTHLSRWIEEQGRLDIARDDIVAFAKYIPEGGVVVDAGACLGDHTATYAKLVGPTGTVWAIEPHPLTCTALKLNFAEKPWVKVVERALSEGHSRCFFKAEENIGACSIEKWTPGDIDVLTVPLDSFALERLDFMHLDCEGHECQVLIGARQTLARCRPVMVLEVNQPCLIRQGGSAEHLVELLSAAGYRCQELVAGHGLHMPMRDILALPV